MNDARIKNCINRYDSSAYTPMQFLDVMSHNMDAHTAALNDHLRGDSDDDDDADEDDAQTTDQTHFAEVVGCPCCGFRRYCSILWRCLIGRLCIILVCVVVVIGVSVWTPML